MALVAGVDSSTQACKVVVRDASTGELVRQGRASHPDGTEVHPDRWWDALQEAVAAAGGLDDVDAVAVGGQQHGMVTLDAGGEVVRPALLWNDTRSAPAARALVEETGAQAWADAVGVVPVASITVAKLRWLREAEPDAAARTAAVCLPHDWLTWRLLGGGPGGLGLDALVTDRGDASGTGYFDPVHGTYRRELLELGLGHDALLPRVLGPSESGGAARTLVRAGALVGPGTGDNAAAALGVGAGVGDVVVSIGTSGVVSGISEVQADDPTGTVAGFADATGRFLPLVCTLNAARVLDATARLLGVDHAGLARARAAGAPGRRRARARPVPRGRAHPQPARGHGVAARPDAGQHDARAPRAGGVRGAVLRARRRHRRPRRAGHDRPARRARRRGRGLARHAGHRAGRASAAPWWSRRPRSTSPTAPPARRHGCCSGATSRPRGRSRASGPWRRRPPRT